MMLNSQVTSQIFWGGRGVEFEINQSRVELGETPSSVVLLGS